MNKLLNNLLGMYKQAKLNKKAEEVVYDSDLIAQVLSMTKNQKEDEFSIVTLSPEKDKVLGVKYIKKDEVYDYKPNQNEYALVMTRDTGFADTDYQLQPMIMVVRSWDEGRKFYATKKNQLNKKAEEDLIEVGWGLYTNDEYEIKDNALYGDDKPQEVNETFWNKINNEIDKVESWFLKEGYKKFFTKVRDEGHGKDSELGGTAWMTENQLKDFMANAEQWDTEFVLAESSGTLDFGNIPVDYNEALSFKLKIYVDDKDLDELGIESKRVSKNKKLSSKAKAMRKRAKNYKEYIWHFNDIMQDALFDNKGDFAKAVEYLLTFASSEYDKARFPREEVYKLVKEYIDDTVKFQEMINHPIKEEYIAKAKELLNNYKIENKIASKNNKLHKQAKKESVVYYDNSLSPREDAQVHKVTYYDTTYNTWGDGNADHEFISVEQFEKETGKKIEELKEKEKITIKLAMTNRNRFGKKADLSKDFDDAESFAKKIIEENKHSFSDYADMQKLENNASSMYFMDNVDIKEILDEAKKMVSEIDSDKNKKLEDANLYFGMKDKALLAEKVLEEKQKQEKQSSKAKLVRKQAKYEETVQGDEKVKDSAKSFGYDIKFAGHYGRWIYYYLIDEKGNIIRDDKEYQKVYDEMKKRIDDDIDIDNYAFAKGLIEEVDGKLMRVPTIVVSEGSLLINHKDRKQASTKKQAGIDPNVSTEDILTLNFDMPIEKADKVKEQFNEKGIKYQSRKGKYTVEFSVDIEAGKVDLVYEIIRNIKKSSSTKKQATIKHENGVYNVYSESGKCLGKGYKTKEEAQKRLKQVEYFKNKSSLKQIVISKMAKIKK